MTMAVPIENPADCEVRSVIFLQADEILGYLAEEAMFSRGIILLHDNAGPHTARHTQALLREELNWDIFEHPPYSPDLASSDFFLLPEMKEHLAGKRFANDEGTKDAS